MTSVTVEIVGKNSAAVDEVTSAMLERFREDAVSVTPAQTSGERDGGVIALAITILGGAASLAQVASTVHALSRKKDVQIVVIDRSGSRTTVNPAQEPEKVQSLLQQAGDGL